MKMILAVVLALVALSAAAPAESVLKEIVEILRSNFDSNKEGGYNFGYESQDGSIRSEVGELKQVTDEENKPQIVVVVRGSYEYIDSEGKKQAVSYTADENGYHAEGDSIPKVPVTARR